MNEDIAAEADLPDAAAQEVLDISTAWSRAIVSNDAEAMGRFMSDDWIIVSGSGVSERDHFLSVVASGDLTHETMEMAELARVRIYGDMAVVVGRMTNNGHHRGTPFSADEWTSDVFVRSGGGWKCVLSQITPKSATPGQ